MEATGKTMAPDITVSIVNYNHAHYLPACIEAVRGQSRPPARIIVVDNASCDASLDVLSALPDDVHVIRNQENLGYAAGHNQAFRRAETAYVMALNCDVILDPGFVEAMLAAMDATPSAGSAGGRLHRGMPGETERLDSTGLFPDRFRRFFDRRHDGAGSCQPPGPSYMFGPSGSAAVFRKAMLDDVAFEGQYFDEDFFAYCEDADLAWRAQRLGWDSLYVPAAVGWHVHDDLSRARSGRRDADANFRQLLLIRNRHLCFLKNDTVAELLRDLLWVLGYDLALQAYLLARKPGLAIRWPLSTLPELPKIARKRADVFRRQRRRVRLSAWFDSQQ
jgi:GT2 family glycosyltransferase